MAKYIDADLLIKEINRLYQEHSCRDYCDEACSVLDQLEDFIDSLQQEQPEESIVKEAVQLVFEEKLTPFKDGNQWCFLLGPNIQEGVCGFGDTILDAAIAFYKDYSTTRIHIGELKKTMEQPKVNLEEEIKFWIRNHVKGGDFEPYKTIKKAVIQWGEIVAHYFYELGKNSK